MADGAVQTGVDGGDRPSILFVAQRYEHGKPEWGDSFEYWNFASALTGAGFDLQYFDIGGLSKSMGKAAMNRRLEEVVRADKPDVMFTILFEDELDRATVRRISDDTVTRTFNWFCDDHWRFEHYTRRWAPVFNLVSTTIRDALPKYEAEGIGQVMLAQWAVNPFTYTRSDGGCKHEVSFVGQPHGARREIVRKLIAEGVPVEVFGSRWGEEFSSGGRISHEEMVRVYGESRINLNMSNSSVPRMTRSKYIRTKVGRRLKSLGVLKPLLFARQMMSGGKPRGEGVSLSLDEAVNLSDQIKGRNFEVPGCGGFILTAACADLDSYYALDSASPERAEVAVYRGLDEMIEKIRYYLDHEEERAAIAERGYRRTVGEHTYLHRFAHIFEKLGHPIGDPAGLIAHRGAAGAIEEVGAG